MGKRHFQIDVTILEKLAIVKGKGGRGEGVEGGRGGKGARGERGKGGKGEYQMSISAYSPHPQGNRLL